MILKCLLFFFILGHAHAWGDIAKWVLNSKSIFKCNHDRSLNLDVSKVDIYFYDFFTNSRKHYAIHDAAEAILQIKHLNKNRQFVLFVGGFKSEINKNTEEQIRQAYKNLPNTYLIIPDHSAYTNTKKGVKKGYERSVSYVHYIGKALGQMLAELTAGSISNRHIHCVGHSLGAQMLAHTGETYFKITGLKLPRITALDPAGPCFAKDSKTEQIRADVADFVEVYHCNSGVLGSSSILGHVDFIVNKKGQSQPKCSNPAQPHRAAICSHKTCVRLWAAIVNNPTIFPAYKCNSYKDFEKAKCSNKDRIFAGARNRGNPKGVFYFSTKNLIPWN